MTNIRIIKGVVIDFDELIKVIKEVFPRVYDSLVLFIAQRRISECSTDDSDDPDFFMQFIYGDCGSTADPEMVGMNPVIPCKKLGGLNIFTWFDGSLAGRTYVIGTLVSIIHLENTANNVCYAEDIYYKQFPINFGNFPSIFSTHPIRCVYMPDACIYR